jgi:hypothetical protein
MGRPDQVSRAAWEAGPRYSPAKLRSEHRDVKIAGSGDPAFARCLHRIKPVGEDHFAGRAWL